MHMVYLCCNYVFLVLNAQLPPTNPEDISDIVFPEGGEAQVTIPASAIIHQRNTEGACLYDVTLKIHTLPYKYYKL